MQINFQNFGLLCLVLVYSAQRSTALVTKAELPWEIQDCYNNYANYSLRDVVGRSLCWACESPVVKRLRTRGIPSAQTPSVTYINSLLERIKEIYGDETTPIRKCLRKEYRTLSDQERERFHRALNTLKDDTSVSPNRYDAVASLHSGDTIISAHGGPNFLGWHRVYLLIIEATLQRVDPDICLPYWDSSLDNELDDPATSYVFSADFLGGRGSIGPVLDGPFAGWETPNFGPLMREIGLFSQLYTADNINNVLSQNRTADISPPNGLFANSIEFGHNDVHIFIGGQMSGLQSAAHDPTFFLHHTFVDYLWETFRTRQRTIGIDPQTDYPEDFGSIIHDPNRQMGFDLNITAIQGYGDDLTKTFEYAPSPICSADKPSCGSRYLQCNVERGRCIPIEPTNLLTTTPPPVCPECPKPKCKKSHSGIQNSYCINGICDIREWVYIPVQIVSVRSPDLKTYESYPVYNESIDYDHDIYQPSAYADISQYIPMRSPKGYDKCHSEHGIGHIYIQSRGLSYEGLYKESVIIDQRLATSIAIGYVAVQNPKKGPAKAIIRAYDSCGRICRPACRIPGTGAYEKCSGVVDIQDVYGRPKQYSRTYGQAILNTWNYSRNKHCPSYTDDDVVLTFYCDYSETIPWINKAHYSSPNECKIDEECTIDVPCGRAKYYCTGQKYKCRGSCNKYAECHFGKYFKKSCPNNWAYDSYLESCNPYRSCSSSGSGYFSHYYL